MEKNWQALGSLFQSHPWHGVLIGKDAPNAVTAYIEIVPTDTIKYELDKVTGILAVDRPQKYSNVSPCLYGFVPVEHAHASDGNRAHQDIAVRDRALGEDADVERIGVAHDVGMAGALGA